MPLKSLRDTNHRVVAVVFLTLMGLAAGFAFAVGQLHLFDRGYTVTAEFKETAGLKPGQDVRVAGVKSGRVESVEPDFKRGRVIVKMHVNAGVDLGGEDTRAEIQTTTLLGGRYVRLTGPVEGPYLARLPESRRVIPLDRTTVPFTVPDALEGAQNIVGKLDQKSIDKLLTSVGRIESPSAAKLREILTNVQQVSRTLNDATPEIEKLIDNSKTITGTLAAKDDKLVQIINSSRVLLDTLVRRRNELAATIGQGSRTVRTLSNVISRNERELNKLLDNLHLLTTRLAPNMDVLNTDLSLLGPTFTQVAGVKGNGKWVEGVITGLGPLQPTGPISSGWPPADRNGDKRDASDARAGGN